MFFAVSLDKESLNPTVLLLLRYYPSSHFSQHLFGVEGGGSGKRGEEEEEGEDLSSV